MEVTERGIITLLSLEFSPNADLFIDSTPSGIEIVDSPERLNESMLITLTVSGIIVWLVPIMSVSVLLSMTALQLLRLS